MLEWITSKVVVSIAALLVLTSVSGFFLTQREGWKENEVLQVSKEISKLVNQVSMINAEATVIVNFGDSTSGFNLPSTIDGEAYTVQLDRTSAKCTLRDLEGRSYFYTAVHLFPPSEVNLTNRTQLRSFDLDHQNLKVHSTGNLFLLRAKTVTDGIVNFETFIFAGE
jgi:type II secretory pathway pseudopilin PulG